MMMVVVESNKKPIFRRVFSEDRLSHFPTLSAKFIKKRVRFSTWNLIFFYSKFRKFGPYFIAFTLKRKGTKKKDKVFFILNLENLVLISLPSHSREKGQKKRQSLESDFHSSNKKKRRTKKHFKEFFFENHFPPMMMIVVEKKRQSLESDFHSSDKKKKKDKKTF